MPKIAKGLNSVNILWNLPFSIKNPYMQFQDPSIHISKNAGAIKKPEIWKCTKSRTSQKQNAPPTSLLSYHPHSLSYSLSYHLKQQKSKKKRKKAWGLQNICKGIYIWKTINVKVKDQVTVQGHSFTVGAQKCEELNHLGLWLINIYKPSVQFLGPRQTVQTQIRHRRTQCLIRVYTVCAVE